MKDSLLNRINKRYGEFVGDLFLMCLAILGMLVIAFWVAVSIKYPIAFSIPFILMGLIVRSVWRE